MSTDVTTWLPGTRNADCARILEVAWQAAQQLGDRGVLITRSDDYATFLAVPSADVPARCIAETVVGRVTHDSSCR